MPEDPLTPEPGDRIEFVAFGEPDQYSTLQPGTLGTVDFIDDAGTIHADWDNGTRLGLVVRPWPDQDDWSFRPDRYRFLPCTCEPDCVDLDCEAHGREARAEIGA